MRKRRQIFTEEPTVNLTPLIDVVFVILFTFVVVAPLLEVDQVELASGSSAVKHATPEKHSPIAIHVYANDTITSTMIKVLNSLVTEDVTQSKGWYATIGCLNNDGFTHGLWLQEQMGWATLEQTMTYENDGDG